MTAETPATPATGEAAGTGGGRLAAVRDWLHGHADTSLCPARAPLVTPLPRGEP